VLQNLDKVKLSTETIEKIVEILRKNGAKRIYIFGSRVRGEASDKSDVDLLVEFSDDAPKGFEFFALKYKVAEEIGMKVDITIQDFLDPYIEPFVMKEAVLIYEE